MISWMKKFLFDETAFVGAVRALVLMAGGGILTYPDAFPLLPKWAGIACMGAAGFIRAGEKNATKETE